MAERPALRALSERAGILPGYRDNTGVHRETSDSTRVALLSAMGFDVSTESSAERERAAWDARERDRIVAPVRVVRVDQRTGWPLAVRPGQRGEGAHDYRLRLREENGTVHTTEGRLSGESARIALPHRPGPGYHELELVIDDGGGPGRVEQRLIVSPGSCTRVEDLLDGAGTYGIWTNLYTVRGRDDWGVGDLADLRELIDWAADVGATFVGINPLHALTNRNGDISPYSPVSRLFRNPLYIDVPSVPELADSPEARAILESDSFGQALHELRDSDHVQYERVMSLKRQVLEALHREFVRRHRGKGTERGTAYERYVQRKDPELTEFATFLALDEHLSDEYPDWRDWPAPYREPGSEMVASFRRQQFEAVDLHRYLQFELDRQLADLAGAAADAGLPIGLYADLAIGSAPCGSDSWAFPDLFVTGAHVGAPPDDYSPTGQDWGLPPLDPRALERDRYRYWIRVVQGALEHAGALRIDHVMGLFRTFWIPAGRPGTEGAYVKYPARDLLGILALESRRRGALIVGEDLGTVPRGLPARLARWGILSSSVLYFERDRRGAFRPSHRYSDRTLVTANTHDHPPLAGYWTGRDLMLRRQAGAIESDVELERALEQRAESKNALLRRLVSEQLLPEARSPARHADLCAAVYGFLARSPAPLVGVALDDLVRETDPVNLPGVGLESYPSWSRRLEPSLERVRSDESVACALRGVADRVYHR